MTVPASLVQADIVARPLEQASTLPGYMYADPAFHGFDAERIFAKSWQLICGAGKLAKAGDHDWVNFYRQDDFAVTAYYYLDRP